MINLDELEGVCDAMIEEGLDWCPPAGCGSAVQVKELIGVLRKAEADAKRYRWLRDEAANLDIRAPLVFMADEYGESERVIDGVALDKHIDEAMNHEGS